MFATGNIRLNYYYDVSKYVKDYARVTYNLTENRMSFQVRDDGGIFYFPLGEQERADFVYMFHDGETTAIEKQQFLNDFIYKMMHNPPESSSYHPFEGEAFSFKGIETKEKTDEDEGYDVLKDLKVSFQKLNKEPGVVVAGQWNKWPELMRTYDWLMFMPHDGKVDFQVSISEGLLEFSVDNQISEQFLNSLLSLGTAEQRGKYLEDFVTEVITNTQSHSIPITIRPENNGAQVYDYREYLASIQRQEDNQNTVGEQTQNGSSYGAYDSPAQQNNPQNDDSSNNSGNTGGGILTVLIIIGLYYMFKGKNKGSKSSTAKQKAEDEEKERRRRNRQKAEDERRRREEYEKNQREMYHFLNGDKP